MSTKGVAEKISINFCWQGSTYSTENQKAEEVVNLIFNNAKALISINVPNTLKSSGAQELLFVCRKDQEADPVSSKALKLSVDQILNLKIGSSFTPEPIEPKIKDKPELGLQYGKDYTLVAKSKNNSFSVRLVETQIVVDRNLLFSCFGDLLYTLMTQELQNFIQQLAQAPSVSTLKYSEIPSSPNDAIYRAIKKIDITALQKLAQEVRITPPLNTLSKEEKYGVKKNLLRRFVNEIGSQKIRHMMFTCLSALFVGSIPSDVHDLIDQSAARLHRICVEI